MDPGLTLAGAEPTSSVGRSSDFRVSPASLLVNRARDVAEFTRIPEVPEVWRLRLQRRVTMAKREADVRSNGGPLYHSVTAAGPSRNWCARQSKSRANLPHRSSLLRRPMRIGRPPTHVETSGEYNGGRVGCQTLRRFMQPGAVTDYGGQLFFQ